MIKKFIKPAWRNLRHNKTYSVINILGFAVSIAACLLIGLSVYHETRFDKDIPGNAQVYRLNEYMHYPGANPQLSADIGIPFASLLKDNHPEIETAVRVLPPSFIYPTITLEYGDKKIRTSKMICTDTSFASLFGVCMMEGDAADFIRDQHSIALTQSLARNLFGAVPAAGKFLTLRVDDTTAYKLTVSNVVRDPSNTSHLQYDGLLPITRDYEHGVYSNNWGIIMGPTYLRIRPRSNIPALQDRLTATIHTKNKFIDMRLQPLAEVHGRSTDVNYETFNYKKIDGKYLRVFIIVGLAIFLIACFNFINLTIAVAAYRGKEIAVRKIMGAHRLQIIAQILAEAFLSVLLALSIAVLLATFFLPGLNAILGLELSATALYQPAVIGIYAAILVITTLLAGFYPALLISSSKVIRALKTKVLFSGSRTTLRNVLVTGQFAIAVVFMVSLIVFLRQLRFMQEKDLGYTTAQVIRVPLDNQSSAKVDVFRSELSKIKGVMGVTNGRMEMGAHGALMGIDYTDPQGKGQHVSVNFENAGPGYTAFFGMKLLDGRDFDKMENGTEYIINETLARQLGHKNPIGQPIRLTSWPAGTIVGVIKDYNYANLHDRIEPLLIGSFGYANWWKKELYIRLSTSDVAGTVAGIGATLKKISTGDDMSWEFMDEHFRQVYSSERQAATLIGIIGGLAVTIACLGLLSLAAFIIVKRAKEIGIRKVLGASVAGVVRNLSGEFMRLVVVGFVIAAPVAWWLMTRWLQDFAYRVGLSWWIFALTGLMAIGIAFFTVSLIAIRAARANPVDSLRSE